MNVIIPSQAFAGRPVILSIEEGTPGEYYTLSIDALHVHEKYLYQPNSLDGTSFHVDISPFFRGMENADMQLGPLDYYYDDTREPISSYVGYQTSVSVNFAGQSGLIYLYSGGARESNAAFFSGSDRLRLLSCYQNGNALYMDRRDYRPFALFGGGSLTLATHGKSQVFDLSSLANSIVFVDLIAFDPQASVFTLSDGEHPPLYVGLQQNQRPGHRVTFLNRYGLYETITFCGDFEISVQESTPAPSEDLEYIPARGEYLKRISRRPLVEHLRLNTGHIHPEIAISVIQEILQSEKVYVKMSYEAHYRGPFRVETSQISLYSTADLFEPKGMDIELTSLESYTFG